MSDANTSNNSRRRVGFVILGAVVLLAALAYGAYWFLDARFYETTDDAYVSGNIVAVTSRENGTVMALHADNTQTVKRGQLLMELDPTVANVNLSAAEANLARAVREATSDFRDTIVTVADAPAEADKALGGVFPDLIVIDSQSAPDTQAGEWITRLLRQNPGERLSVILVTNPEALQGTITTLPPLGAGPLPLSALGTTVKNILD